MADWPPMKTKMITRTRISPEMMLFSRSATIRRTSLDISAVRSIVRFCGSFGRISLTIRLTSSVTRTMFSPLRFDTAIDTLFSPLMRLRVSGSLKESLISATSRRYTGMPSRTKATMEKISEGCLKSSGTRTRYLASPMSMLPPGMLTLLRVTELMMLEKGTL